jgi:hypothetical protein
MGKRGGAYMILVGKPEVRRALGNGGVDGRIILKLILDKWDGQVGMD